MEKNHTYFQVVIVDPLTGFFLPAHAYGVETPRCDTLEQAKTEKERWVGYHQYENLDLGIQKVTTELLEGE